MNEEIKEIEVSMEQAKAAVAMRDSLNKLFSNKDFKKVIMEGYFKEEAVRLVLTKAHSNHQDKDSQEQLSKDIDAIGRLNEYFRHIFLQGQMAESAIAEGSEALEQIRNELDGE